VNVECNPQFAWNQCHFRYISVGESHCAVPKDPDTLTEWTPVESNLMFQ
jgi:hypothetical protein